MPAEQTAAAAVASQARGLLWVVVAALFIGIMPNAAKLAYGAGANPIAVLLVRAATAVVGLAVFLRLRGETPAIPPPYVRPTALAGFAMLFSAGGGMGAVAYID